MLIKSLVVSSGIAALSLAAQASHAAENFYLTIPGITGEVLDKGFVGSIALTSFAEMLGVGGANAQANARAVCGDMQAVKMIDSASPLLAFAVAAGTRYPTMTLSVVKLGENSQQPFVTFTLANTAVSSISFGGDAVNSARVETLTLHPANVQISYVPQGAGGRPGTPIQTTVDCKGA
jgi:type VI protein secretion system component Hcp